MLFCEKFYVTSENMVNLALHPMINTMKDKEVIHSYKYYFTDIGNGFSSEELDEFYRSLVFIRNKKLRNKNELILLGRLEKDLKNIRGEVQRGSDNFIATNKLESMVGFVEDKSILINDWSNEDNFNMLKLPMFMDFSSGDILHILTMDTKPNLADFKDRNTEPMTDLGLWYSNHLCYLPSLESLSYSQMKIIRNEFKEKLGQVNKMIIDMQAEFKEIVLTLKNLNNVGIRFDELSDQIQPVFHEAVEQNIYFQQIENSASEKKYFELNIAFTTLQNILSYYRQIHVVSEIEETMLMEKIAQNSNVNTCCVFMYMGEVTE
jgi:hypothetical protein